MLRGDMVWRPSQSPFTVSGDLIVPPGATLTILPGSTVLFQEGARIVIRGRLVAEGTAGSPIRFTRAADTGRWRGLQFEGTTEESRIRHALLEYASTNDGMIGVQRSRLLVEYVAFDHCDRRRIRTIDSSLIVRGCRFGDLFGPDEPPTTDNMSEHLWGSGIPDGGHLVVDGNVFGRNKGHNDAIDFDGPARPKPIPHIRNNLFLGGGDDALDLECDALIEGNVFVSFVKDKYNKASGEANVLSGGSGRHYVLAHNLILNVQHIAQVKNSAFLTFTNNTAVGVSGAAIYFDLGLPGRRPGRGAVVENAIFWRCPHVFAGVAAETELTVNYSLLAPAWHSRGVGNIDGDPLFVRESGTPGGLDGDYHLKSQAGRWDACGQRWIEDDVTSPCIDAGDPNADWSAELWPHGGRINMGAHGGTPEAGMSLSSVGDRTDLDHSGLVGAKDMLRFTGRWLDGTAPLAEDMNRDGSVNFHDFGRLARRWQTDLRLDSEPFDVALGARARWSPVHAGYDPGLPGYRVVGDIASIAIRARTDDLPGRLVLGICPFPGRTAMLEGFTLTAPCVMLTGEPFKGIGLTCRRRADSSVPWQSESTVATDAYFQFDIVGDEVHVTWLPAAIEMLRVPCKVSWVDWYR